jgi:rubrerythrin
MSAETRIMHLFLSRVLRTPEGRAHMLNVAIEAEEGDEAGVFDQLIATLEDRKLKTIVTKHRDDELRHAGLFRECLRRTGVTPHPLPDRLRLIRSVARKAGGAFATGAEGGNASHLQTREDVMSTYALLLAIEKSGVQRFPILAAEFRKHDPDTADTFLRVAKDEARHVKYCEAIGRRHAPSDAAWRQAVQRYARAEQSALREVSLANVAYCVSRGFVLPGFATWLGARAGAMAA